MIHSPTHCFAEFYEPGSLYVANDGLEVVTLLSLIPKCRVPNVCLHAHLSFPFYETKLRVPGRAAEGRNVHKCTEALL